MNNDIRLSTGFYSHPKTIKLMRIVGAEGVLCLQRLWIWSAQNRADGNLAGFEDEDIEIAACWSGACGEFVQALAKLRFLDGDTGAYALHGWDEHQGYVTQEAERIARAKKAANTRWGKNPSDASSNAPSMPEAQKSGASSNAPNQTKPSIRREDSLRSSSCPEHPCGDSGPMPATLDAVITLPLNTGEEHPVTQGEIDQWQDLYPSVDVPQALRSMKGWLIANRQKRKTKTGISRFVQAWLGREQDRGGSNCAPRAAPAGNAKQESQADRAARLTFEAGMSVLAEMEQRGTQGGRALNAR